MTTYALAPVDTTNDVELAVYPPLIRRLLARRGITTEAAAAQFLAPDWQRDTHDPFLMKDMDMVVTRLVDAMQAGETIALWSDYDMDGIPGAALLHDCFRALRYEKVLHHTPHRNRDGFGLNTQGLDELKAAGADLVITIDCGIGDIEQVAYANSLGLTVIITDHHLPHETLPSAYAILNPKQADCAYPEDMLCGAGVAFKLVQGMLQRLRSMDEPPAAYVPHEGWEKWLLDMAGMSTIADMVPLVGENRVLAHYGLLVLQKSRRPGLQALLRKARATQRHLTEDDIGFTIAPRINAASRMGHARDAFQLLATNDQEEAGALAHALEAINRERKTAVAVMKREITSRMKKSAHDAPVLVMGNLDWKPSLLGLVAGGLAEEHGRPVFLWGREEGTTIKGSCRSDGTVPVFALMQHAHEVFEEFGGHAYSGGFSVDHARVHELEAALVAAFKTLAATPTDTTRSVDATLSLEEVSWETYRAMRMLGPFGEGNPKPLFALRNVEPHAIRQFGKGGEHLEVQFGTSAHATKAIAFFAHAASFSVPLAESVPVQALVHLEASYFRGTPELRLRIVDAVHTLDAPREGTC